MKIEKWEQFRAIYQKNKNFYLNHIHLYKMKLSAPDQYDVIKRNKELKNTRMGQRCFIIGNGPSLKTQDLSMLENEYVFTVNQAARHKDFEKIKTNYHFWTDPNFFVIDESCPEDMAIIRMMQSVKTKDNNPICFFPIEKKAFVEKYGLDRELKVRYLAAKLGWIYEGFHETIALDRYIPVFGTVVQFCMVAAIYMGFREIYLLGCDNTGMMVTIKSALQENNSEDYAYELSENEKLRMTKAVKRNGIELNAKAYLYDIKAYRILNDYCNSKDIKLINCSAQTIIDSVPRKRYEDVLCLS